MRSIIATVILGLLATAGLASAKDEPKPPQSIEEPRQHLEMQHRASRPSQKPTGRVFG